MPETACVRFAEISDKDRVIALLKKVLKSGSMMDTADSDIIANFVARQKKRYANTQREKLRFLPFFNGNSPFPAVDFRQSA